MNREIKFRAWHTSTKRWARDFKLDPNGNLFIGQGIANEYKYLAGMDYVLMQFTGLLDKNGKEIFEGDIVRTISIRVILEDMTEDEKDLFREMGLKDSNPEYDGKTWVVGNVGYEFDLEILGKNPVIHKIKNTELETHIRRTTFGGFAKNELEVIGNIYENPELLTNHKLKRV